MKVTISDRKLRKAVDNERKLIKEYGPLRAKKIKLRLDVDTFGWR